MTGQIPVDNSKILGDARSAVASGFIERAMGLYAAILEQNPDHLESLHFLGMTLIDHGQYEQGEPLLRRAVELAPNDPRQIISLARAHRGRGDAASALAYFEQAVRVTPSFPPALLELGILREQLGNSFDALRAYVVAVGEAQKHGQWKSAETTPKHLHDQVGHAMRFIQSFAPLYYGEILDSLRVRFGSDSLGRVRKCVDEYLARIKRTEDLERSFSKFLHFPNLPETAYFPLDLFPWMHALESQTETISTELESLIAQRLEMQPFLTLSSDAQVTDYIGGEKGVSGWGAFFFYRHSKRFSKMANLCPATSRAIETLPLVRIPDASPEVLFSILASGTEIKPHRGVTNTRSVLHLPIIVPPECALKVGGIDHVWKKGRGVVFDDTFEHSAWNRGHEDRIILIADVWNPYLTEVEQIALTELVPAIANVETNLKLK